jgi:hypothetical protein
MTRARQVESHHAHHDARGARSAVSGRRAAAMTMGGWVALLLACNGPDPAGKFDEFVEQTRESTDGTTDSGTSGTSTTEPTTGGPELFDISGDFLLAVATTVDQDKPLQFIATTVVADMGGAQVLTSLCLQPLTLTQGKVLVPREPIGDPLCFKDLAITDNKFTLDAGVVSVTGMANPITGANIVASLIMAANIKSDDLYCGAVTGEVMEPPVGDITGSTFAAVRLADVKVLPDPVVVDCAGRTVTDL